MAVHGRTPTEFFGAPAGTQKVVGVLQMMLAIYPQQLNIARDTKYDPAYLGGNAHPARLAA
jgi:hypothetical protein